MRKFYYIFKLLLTWPPLKAVFFKTNTSFSGGRVTAATNNTTLAIAGFTFTSSRWPPLEVSFIIPVPHELQKIINSRGLKPLPSRPILSTSGAHCCRR